MNGFRTYCHDELSDLYALWRASLLLQVQIENIFGFYPITPAASCRSY